MKPYFDDGQVAIYHGDCRDVLPLISADVMVSDPPYGMGYQSGWKESSRIANDNSTECRDRALDIWAGRPALVFGRWSVSRPANVRELLIWDKGDWPGMGDLSLPYASRRPDLSRLEIGETTLDLFSSVGGGLRTA